MAKTYRFRITLRRAEFYRGGASVAYGLRNPGPDCFHDSAHVLTLADAIAKRAEISAGEKRPHAAFLSLQYRNDRSPPGMKDKAKVLYFNPDEVTA